MIIIADASPINYLVLIDLIQILPDLFEQVLIPQTVLQELQSTAAPDVVRQWVTNRPGWLIVQAAKQEDPTLSNLDVGEREVITLAQELKADLLILDESRGRQAAVRRGYSITGTIGLLDKAGARGLIDVPDAIARLRQTSFRASPRLLNFLLSRHRAE
jgi:predicted nucleic acid-binding protein